MLISMSLKNANILIQKIKYNYRLLFFFTYYLLYLTDFLFHMFYTANSLRALKRIS